MSFKTIENNNLDENLRNWVWINRDNSTHYFVSFLHEKYPVETFPHMWERFPKIEAKPGKLTVIPHRYYKIHTRDDMPAKGTELTMNEAIEAFSPRSLTGGKLE